ncbi:MAG: hypothetical protein LBG93_03485, partial [Treponema sp.]|nr:hypothetical protein [Treponema sp.]
MAYDETASLVEGLRAFLFSLGAHKVGFDDLQPYRKLIELEYGDVWLDYPRAVSVAVNFPRAVMNELCDGPTLTYVRYYDALNASLDHIGVYG